MHKKTQLTEIKALLRELDRLRPNIPANVDKMTGLLSELTEKVQTFSTIVVHEKYSAGFDSAVLETDQQELLDIVKYASTIPAAATILRVWVSSFHENFTNHYGTLNGDATPNGDGTLPSAEILLWEGGTVTSDFVEAVKKFARITGTHVSVFDIMGEVHDSRYDSEVPMFLVVGGTNFDRAVIVPSYSLGFIKSQTADQFDIISMPLSSALEDIQTKIYLPKNY